MPQNIFQIFNQFHQGALRKNVPKLYRHIITIIMSKTNKACQCLS